MQLPHRPVVLVIVDGWGIAPPSNGNPLTSAKTPNIDWFVDTFPTMALQASGEAVGLPWGEMGNSEVGHLNLGAGKIIYQSLPRISKAIAEGSFFENAAFRRAVEHARKHRSALHLIGLVSNGGVHSSIEHLFGLLELCHKEKVEKVYIHAILDGRDTARDSGAVFIERLLKKMKDLKTGELATISGRFYAMDRDNRWEREQQAYEAMATGTAERYTTSPVKFIKQSYEQENYDEEFIPTVVGKEGAPTATVSDGDAAIFFNFRPDRARQLTKAFTLPGFDQFERGAYMQDLLFVTMTQYDKDLPVIVAYPPEAIEYPVARVISEAGLKQLHIAETEKYAHVTYFFNGGKEKPFKGQENVLIPSPKVASYNQQPEMSGKLIAERLVKEIKKNAYDFIVVNFANPDMVGHTGDVAATKQSMEYVDEWLGELSKLILSSDGLLFITADHGNAEELTNLQTGAMDKEHSVNPVPFIAVGKQWEGQTLYKDLIVEHDLSTLSPTGILSDVPVTILAAMKLPAPSDMTGHNLLSL